MLRWAPVSLSAAVSTSSEAGRPPVRGVIRMGHERIAGRVAKVPPSGIRRFFDIVAQMPDVISLGIGEPDFVTPEHIRPAATRGLEVGSTAYTAYTSNSGLLELRLALAAYVEQ